jgi:DNA-binding response OmpR family regulator
MAAKILVTDDEPDVVNTIAHCLRMEGFEVVTATDGLEALDVVCREKPDLVILDVMMPKENGYRVSRKIKEYAELGLFDKQIRTIILTGRVLDESSREELFLEYSHADCVMNKPFDMDALIAKVMELLAA